MVDLPTLHGSAYFEQSATPTFTTTPPLSSSPGQAQPLRAGHGGDQPGGPEADHQLGGRPAAELRQAAPHQELGPAAQGAGRTQQPRRTPVPGQGTVIMLHIYLFYITTELFYIGTYYAEIVLFRIFVFHVQYSISVPVIM